MAKATSISAAKLADFTRLAVKAAAQNVPGKLVLKGPTLGYILAGELGAAKALDLATAITSGVAVNARQAGVSGLKPKPVVIARPGNITLGFIAQELGINVRQ